MSDNPHKEAAQLKKAYALADWLEANMRDETAAALEAGTLLELPDEWWGNVAWWVGVNKPSTETREKVVGILTDRKAMRDRDPFAPFETHDVPKVEPAWFAGCAAAAERGK